MGTRSLTIFKDEDGKEICVLYRQMDGYPRGHGQDLADFLKGKKLCNGYTGADEAARNFNGMGDLAAQVIAHFKTFQDRRTPDARVKSGDLSRKEEYGPPETGQFYIHAAGTRDQGEEYIYMIYPAAAKRDRILFEAQDCNMNPKGPLPFFIGIPDEFDGRQLEDMLEKLAASND